MVNFKEEKIDITNNSGYKWYIIQTYNSLTARGTLSQDDRRKGDKLRDIFEKNGKSYLIEEIFVAIEEKKNPYNGEIQYINIAPGYIFIKMLFNNEVKALLTEHQNSIGLIMGGYTNAHVVPPHEIDNMKKVVEVKNQAKDDFVIGNMVKITHRDFTDFQGVITEVFDDGHVNVTISIFGRNTVVKCSIKDVEKIDDNHM